MIYVQLNKEDFEYDIHSLVKAFFPSENVSVCAQNKQAGEPACLRMEVCYLLDRVELKADGAAKKEVGLFYGGLYR